MVRGVLCVAKDRDDLDILAAALVEAGVHRAANEFQLQQDAVQLVVPDARSLLEAIPAVASDPDAALRGVQVLGQSGVHDAVCFSLQEANRYVEGGHMPALHHTLD